VFGLSRRRSTIRPVRESASEVSSAPKTFELEQRISRVEIRCQEILDAVNALKLRNITLQAQLDHVIAKLTLWR
jgi:hypothetical protein